MKKQLSTFLVLFTSSLAFGAVTFQLNESGFENVSGVATDGMAFGWIVDTNGDGFSPGSYLGFDINFNGQFLENTLSGATDDWFVYGGTQGSAQNPPVTADVFPLGPGTISSNADIAYNTSLGSFNSSMEFAVMWFPTGSAFNEGDVYGFATDTSTELKMLVPADTFANSVPDSISTKTPSFAVVPEPAHFAVAFGLLGLGVVMWRRRR